MANNENLTPFTGADDSHRSNGRPAGIPNRKTILNYLLFEADIEEMGLAPKKKPEWWDKVKPKKIYEVMTLAMGAKAMSGDDKAFSALNKALGTKIEVDGKINVALVKFIDAPDNNDTDKHTE